MLPNRKENKPCTSPGALKKGQGQYNTSVLIAVTRHNTPIMAILKANKKRDEWRTIKNSTGD